MSDGPAIGRAGLRALRQQLLTLAPDQAVTILQQAGYAAGEDVYRAFCAWLPEHEGVAGFEDVDAAHLSDVLSEFFDTRGWGRITLAPLAGAAFAVDSSDWAEADPGAADAPTCFFTSGMLADFLGRLSGEAVAVMEVECRSRNDARCRFLSATPATLQRVYDGMTAGQTYEEALTTPTGRET